MSDHQCIATHVSADEVVVDTHQLGRHFITTCLIVINCNKYLYFYELY